MVGFSGIVLRYERERRGQRLVRSVERTDRAELQFRRRYAGVDSILARYDGVQGISLVAADIEIVGRVLAQKNIIIQFLAGRLPLDMNIGRPRRCFRPVTLGLRRDGRHFSLQVFQQVKRTGQ